MLIVTSTEDVQMPAPTVANGDVIEIIVDQKVAAQTCLTVTHYQATVTGAPVAFNVLALATANLLKTAGNWVNSLNAIQTEEVIQDLIKLQIVAPVRFYQGQYGGLGVGKRNPDNTLGTAPSNLAITGTRSPFTADKGRVSTTHFCGFGNDYIENSKVTPAGRAAINEIIAQMLQPLAVSGGVTLVPVLWSRKPGLPVRDFGTGIAAFESRVMRRRTVGLGI